MKPCRMCNPRFHLICEFFLGRKVTTRPAENVRDDMKYVRSCPIMNYYTGYRSSRVTGRVYLVPKFEPKHVPSAGR